MYFSDTHTHSLCSPDGHATMLEMAQAAQSLGLAELTITDHCDLRPEHGGIQLTYDWTPTREAYTQAQDALHGAFCLKRGIEIAGISGYEPKADEILREPLDFVIGSVHNLTIEDGMDFYYYDYKGAPALCASHLDNYMDALESTVRWGGFDTLGHVPYPLRYMCRRDGNPLTLDGYEERLRVLLRSLIQQGKSLELNTCRGGTVEDYRTLFTWYRQLGGELLTISSDAHYPADIGKGIGDAQTLLRELGFRWHCTYTNRKPEFHAL